MRLLTFLLLLLCANLAFGWRFFGRGSSYNSFGGYTASRFYNGAFPYYNQPMYPRYQQPYFGNGPYSYNNPYNYRGWQRNGVGYYGPDAYRFVNTGSRDTQGFSPYDFYGK